jgi:hypothetical protein
MQRFHGSTIAGTTALALALGVAGLGQAQQDPGPGKKAGQKLDELGRSIKKGLQGAGDTIREQFSKVRNAVHNMDIAAREYGRLHWDKSLTTCALDLEVKGGTVTLRGDVPDAKAKVKAAELARETVGITEVVDQLNISPTPGIVPGSHADRPPGP